MTSSKPGSNIRYRSKPAEVSMGDGWYELASLDHFWVKHRFKVFNAIFRSANIGNSCLRVADIGCGHGLLQSQLKDAFRWIVDGYDLNQAALSNSIAGDQPVVFYNVNERHPDIKCAYDVIFLFDVIEHLDDEEAFLQSVKFHLKPGGLLVINVPAGPWLFSRYDEVAGHFRRYNWRTFNDTVKRAGFTRVTCTYWGLTYVPLIIARKIMLGFRKRRSNAQINAIGFKPPSNAVNNLLKLLSCFDLLPNHFAGSSLMSIFRY
jgi:SAM-dependent methyltransferase